MQAIEYRVRVRPAQQQIDVELKLPSLAEVPVKLSTPTWVPGAYGFMKYGRDLFNVAARDATSGKSLSIRREGWSSYVVDPIGASTIVTYSASASETAWGELAGVVDGHQAVLLGTRYLFVEGHNGPCRVTYELPAGWPLHHPAGAKRVGATTYEYPSYALLLDTPVCLGSFEVRTRSAQGATFLHVFLDRTVAFDAKVESFIDSVMKVAEECRTLFGSFPFESYSFIYTFDPRASWGLEHTHSTMIALDPNTLIDEAAWFDGIRVAAHELFHAWNVCRLKPAALMAPDFTRGSFGDGLWVSEGFTRYYEFLLSVRAGEMTAESFIANVANYFRHLEAVPASRRVSAADSSYATFLNHNRYPGSVNNTVDYYDVGMLIAFDVDATARLHEVGTLDELFRGFYEAYRERGFTTADLKAFLRERHPALGALIEQEVEAAGRLGTIDLLSALGFETTFEERPRLGLVLQENKGPAIANVLDDSAASRVGLAPGDELLYVAGHPYSLKALRWLIENEPSFELLVKRGPRQLSFVVTPEKRHSLTSVGWVGSEAQLERIRRWLALPALEFSSEPLSLQPHYNFHGIQAVL
jgi:predicted metalloprotease with PDZ domain